MQARRSILPIAVLLPLVVLFGCNRNPSQTAKALNSDSQSTQATTAANQPDNSGASSDQASSDLATTTTNAPVQNAAADTNPRSGPDATAQVPQQFTIPAGTPVTVRLQQRLSSASAVPGERFEAVLDEPIVADDRTLLPVGTPVFGHVVLARRSGRLHHPGELGLTLDTVVIGQQNVPLYTSNVVARGASHKKRNLAWIGGGTGGGALVGALAAGGKGALIGSGIGAAAGVTTALFTGKKDVSYGSERRLRFRLNRGLSLPA
ncbi:MAG: hypothetical protein WCC87_01380 [Candidatus Korobacteraceae bacterium]